MPTLQNTVCTPFSAPTRILHRLSITSFATWYKPFKCCKSKQQKKTIRPHVFNHHRQLNCVSISMSFVRVTRPRLCPQAFPCTPQACSWPTRSNRDPADPVPKCQSLAPRSQQLTTRRCRRGLILPRPCLLRWVAQKQATEITRERAGGMVAVSQRYPG